MAQDDNAKLGILMLDTRFPRIKGDVGNAATWNFPVRYAVVPGATPEAIVQSDPLPFVDAFVSAGRTLVAQGCTGIATTCGFLAPLRTEVAHKIGAPVAASALEQARQIVSTLPSDRRLGILTISKTSLTASDLIAAHVPADVIIAGVESTQFAATILGNKPDLDVSYAREEMVLAALDLTEKTPTIGAILLECTNMVPYAADIAAATGRPVYSIYSYLNWFHESLAPAQW